MDIILSQCSLTKLLSANAERAHENLEACVLDHMLYFSEFLEK